MKKQALGIETLLTAILYHNPPDLLYICVGLSAKKDFAAINRPRKGSLAIVILDKYHPSIYNLPVSGLDCVIQWSLGPNQEYIKTLVNELLDRGALRVTVLPEFADFAEHSHDLENSTWVQKREMIQPFTKKTDKDNVPEQQ